MASRGSLNHLCGSFQPLASLMQDLAMVILRSLPDGATNICARNSINRSLTPEFSQVRQCNLKSVCLFM